MRGDGGVNEGDRKGEAAVETELGDFRQMSSGSSRTDVKVPAWHGRMRKFLEGRELKQRPAATGGPDWTAMGRSGHGRLDDPLFREEASSAQWSMISSISGRKWTKLSSRS
ncbi:MAG: hypothetical protein ABSG91_02505 [Syntrophobacteraceae bacterium]